MGMNVGMLAYLTHRDELQTSFVILDFRHPVTLYWYSSQRRHCAHSGYWLAFLAATQTHGWGTGTSFHLICWLQSALGIVLTQKVVGLRRLVLGNVHVFGLNTLIPRIGGDTSIGSLEQLLLGIGQRTGHLLCQSTETRLLGIDWRATRLPDPGAARGALLIPRRGISGVFGQATKPAPLCAMLSFPAGAEVGLAGACVPATLCLLLSIRISSALFMRVLLSGTAPWSSWFSTASSSSLLE